MPRENRKRGRGKRAQNEAVQREDGGFEAPRPPTPSPVDVMDVAVEGPIAASSTDPVAAVPACAPFPELDPDSKAYWRGIDDKIRELEGLGFGKGKQRRRDGDEDEADGEEEDERQLLLRSALAELSGHELALAADPETSIILERLLYSMDDFAKRVLMDRFAGEFSSLSSHRHASHPLQTLLTLSAPPLEREAKGKATKKHDVESDVGELLGMSELLVGACEELLPNLAELARNPSASHILGLVLILSSGKPLPEDSFRSKKSTKWRARQAGGPMRGLLTHPDESIEEAAQGESNSKRKNKLFASAKVTDAVRQAGDKLYHALRDLWRQGNGVAARQAASDTVTSQLVQIVLQREAERNESEVAGSLTDAVVDGLVEKMLSVQEDKQVQATRSDYVETALRDATPSHALEVVISNASPRLFDALFSVYFSQRLGKLCSHPVANFVITKVLLRLTATRIPEATTEVGPKMSELVGSGRTGPMQALVARAAAVGSGEAEVLKAVLEAFDVADKEADKRRFAVPCIVSLMRVEHFRKTTAFVTLSGGADTDSGRLVLPESAMQGSLLLQSLLRLSSPAVDPLLDDSFHTLPLAFVLAYSRDPVASRIFDVVLSNPSLAPRHRRKFLLSLIGSYDVLADDRVGSRVADRCWEAADGYLKEKIASSLVGQKEQRALQASAWGHHFARKLHLPLFERRREEWKVKVAEESPASKALPIPSLQKAQTVSTSPDPVPAQGTKRPADELDAIFDPVVKPKAKKSRSSPANPFRLGQGEGHKAAKGRKPGKGRGQAGDGEDAVAAAAAQVLGDKAMKDLMRMVKRS